MLYYSNFLNNFHYYILYVMFQLLLEIFQILEIVTMIFYVSIKCIILKIGLN